MKKVFFLILICSCTNSLLAQDPHFSQFFASPLTLNPAYTGKFDGVVRAAGNYRNQWPSINNAFTTGTLSVDFPILENRIPETDRFGIGFLGLTDRNGNGILRNNYFGASIAYHKGLDEDGYHQIGIGFQGVYTNKRLDLTQAKFEDMLTTSGFTGVTQEIFSNYNELQINYADLNAGIMYSGSTTDDNFFYFGVSGYHLNKPKESFRGADYVLNGRFAIHGGGYFPVGENMSLHTSLIHQRQAGSANETVGGGALGYTVPTGNAIDKPTVFYAGAWYRLNDAIIPYLGLEWNDFRLGLTYDVNVSSLRTASNLRGGIEISLIYIKQRNQGGKPIKCPKF
jgi:type IX secretion system PorP/SprF family membrane protein